MLRRRPVRPFVALTVAAVVAALAPAVGGPSAAAADPSPSEAASGTDAVWTSVDTALKARDGGLRRRVDPAAFEAYRLDLPTLAARLDRAPLETARRGVPATISVPSPDGDLVEFTVTESPVMEDGLAALHPEITTYAGRATGDAVASIRLDVTPMGFHAAVRGDGAAWYVDPAYNGTDQGADAVYLSYRGDDLPEPEQPLVEPELDVAPRQGRAPSDPSVGEGPGATAVQRTYRLALVTDPSYAAYFSSSTDQSVVNPIVTAEKATLMNRVNQVYGDDLSVRMLLVAGTDALNFNTAAQFTGTNGRCGQVACYTAAQVGAGCDSPTLDQNRYVVGQLIGADNYDIGHIAFGPAGDGGGIAGLGVVGTSDKAAGCTGLAPPTGDGFAIDYVAHEMGHQFSGNHTFNGTTGSCSATNRNAGTSVEPGSGTSVMAYAGICGVDNLQSHSDPYFSQRSQTEIAAFTRGTESNLREIQNVALSGFGSGEAFTLTYGGATTAAITSGGTYTAAGIKAAVEAAEPSSATATVTGYWGLSTALTNGFQITWSGTANIATPTLNVTSGTFTSVVGTTDNGGPATNGGFDNPAPTGNRNPTVTAPAARTIPIRTPFQLTGSATDPDGDALRYLWEQNDTATLGTTLNSNTKLTGPLFRIFGTYATVTAAGTQQYQSPGENLVTNSPTRSFPDLAQVVAGSTNAASGSCPTYTGTGTTETAALNCFSEFLPTTARTMSFRLTARDLGGADGGSDGGTSFADTAITVGTAGPFLATSQATATSVTGGTSGTVAWNVAGTNTATYATNVKISLSTDGGLTFPTVLAASTPNDGTEAVTWPNGVSTSAGRIKIEAVDNYFYDVTDGAITITPAVAPTPALTTGGNAAGGSFTAASSDALGTTPTITASSATVDGSGITATPSGLPTGLTLTRGTTSASGVRPGTTQFSVSGTANVDPGTYPVTVTVADGAAASQTVSFTVVVTKDAATLVYTGDTRTTATQGGTDAVQVTVSASVTDTDATPGTPSGTVRFTDQTTGELLCDATVTSGSASCTFGADLTGTDDRTYQVVGTLTGPRYTGASPAAALVVQYDAGLVVTGPPATATVPYSDALDPALTAALTSRFVASEAFTATAAGLPAGLELTRTARSADGVTPGTATYAVTGTVTDAPGSYPVTLTFSDGQHAAQVRTTTITVAREDATVTYTGPTAVEADAGATSTTFAVSADVAETDTTAGDLTTATVTFTDTTTDEVLCTAPVTASGAATCDVTAELPADADRVYTVGLTVGGRYTGSAEPTSVTLTQATDTTAPSVRITAGPAEGSFVLTDTTTVEYTSEPGVSYVCSFDGQAGACPSDGRITLGLRAGKQLTFAVVAIDEAGNVSDPASRHFATPVNSSGLTRVSGPWTKVSQAAAYRGSYLTASTRGATLSYRVTGATRLALVAGRGQRLGTVTVYLGQRKLRVIDLAGASSARELRQVATFAEPTTGTVRIVSNTGEPVRIEGLGVAK